MRSKSWKKLAEAMLRATNAFVAFQLAIINPDNSFMPIRTYWIFTFYLDETEKELEYI